MIGVQRQDQSPHLCLDPVRSASQGRSRLRALLGGMEAHTVTTIPIAMSHTSSKGTITSPESRICCTTARILRVVAFVGTCGKSDATNAATSFIRAKLDGTPIDNEAVEYTFAFSYVVMTKCSTMNPSLWCAKTTVLVLVCWLDRFVGWTGLTHVACCGPAATATSA